MWLGMLAGAVGQLSATAAALVNAPNLFCLGFLESVASGAAALPNAAVPLHVGLAATIAAYAAMALAVHVRRARSPLAVLVLLVAGGAVALRPAAASPPSALTVSFLDVGQGDATLIQHGGAAILVDTGPRTARSSSGCARRARAGSTRSWSPTHRPTTRAPPRRSSAACPCACSSTAVTGRPPARTRRSSPRPAPPRPRLAAPPARSCAPADRAARPLAPPRPPTAARRHRSQPAGGRRPHPRRGVRPPAACRRRIRRHRRAGPPARRRVEGRPPRQRRPRPAALLERLRPRVAAIEVGRRNRYGHPTAQALGALRAAVPSIYRTDRDGTVRLTVSGARMEVRTAR